MRERVRENFRNGWDLPEIEKKMDMGFLLFNLGVITVGRVELMGYGWVCECRE